MITIKPYTPLIFLINKDGEKIKTWNTVLRCAIELPKLLNSKNLWNAFDLIGSKNYYTRSINRFRTNDEEIVLLPYLLKNEYGEDITFRQTFNAVRSLKKDYTGQSRTPGSKTHKYSNYYRYPKTLSILRNDFIIEEDNEPKIRTSRNKNHIPNAWDDNYRHIQKSWKKHRKQQWKD